MCLAVLGVTTAGAAVGESGTDMNCSSSAVDFGGVVLIRRFSGASACCRHLHFGTELRLATEHAYRQVLSQHYLNLYGCF